MNVCVRAAGIDAPLLWDKRRKRWADPELSNALTKVKKALKKESVVPRPPVQAVNSLKGACTVQVTLLVRHLIEKREYWKCQDLAITESHPKALEYLLANSKEHEMIYQMTKKLTKGLSIEKARDHERDATLGAVSAWVAIRKRPSSMWKNLYEDDSGLIYPPGISAEYWMLVAR